LLFGIKRSKSRRLSTFCTTAFAITQQHVVESARPLNVPCRSKASANAGVACCAEVTLLRNVIY
jgi:hypothetical protein